MSRSKGYLISMPPSRRPDTLHAQQSHLFVKDLCLMALPENVQGLAYLRLCGP